MVYAKWNELEGWNYHMLNMWRCAEQMRTKMNDIDIEVKREAFESLKQDRRTLKQWER
jgi:hypothetical protein